MCILDAVDHCETSKSHCNDAMRRKELYRRLSEYLDRRQVRSRGQTYIFPDLINRLTRCRFPNDIRVYQVVRTLENGKLTDVSDGNKYYVQWEDFSKNIH